MLEMDRQVTKYRYGIFGVRAAAAKLPGNCHPPEEHSMPPSPGYTTQWECPISELPDKGGGEQIGTSGRLPTGRDPK